MNKERLAKEAAINESETLTKEDEIEHHGDIRRAFKKFLGPKGKGMLLKKKNAINESESSKDKKTSAKKADKEDVYCNLMFCSSSLIVISP